MISDVSIYITNIKYSVFIKLITWLKTKRRDEFIKCRVLKNVQGETHKSLFGPFNNQVLVEQVYKIEQTINSPLSNSVKQDERPSLCR